MPRRHRRGYRPCPYRNHELPSDQFTDEHIWPQSLGGRAAGSSFVLRVCEPCNSTCGLFVDGQFAKSWFVTNQMATDAFCYLDLDVGTPLPMLFVGRVKGLDPSPYEHADLWSAACRSRVLHLHSHGGDKWYGYAGGNPIARKKNPGAAIFLNAADDERWLRVGLRSFWERFRKEDRMVFGVGFSNQKDRAAFGQTPDSVHQAIVDRYLPLDRPGEPTAFEISVRMDFDQRFMAKVALGFGAKYLGETFVKSGWADLLRKTLWAKSAVEQERLQSIGSGMFDKSSEDLHELIRWEGGITLAFVPAGQFLVLQMSVFGAYYSVVVSDDPAVWSKWPDLQQGLAWVIIPQRDFCEGPLQLAAYLGHKQGHATIDRLAEAASWRIDASRVRDPPGG